MEKEGFDKTEKGKKVNNIPDSGTLTGNWQINNYGCWWEYKLDDPYISETWGKREEAWIIGDYPDKY